MGSTLSSPDLNAGVLGGGDQGRFQCTGELACGGAMGLGRAKKKEMGYRATSIEVRQPEVRACCT